MKYIIIIFILFFSSLVISEEVIIEETRFEKFWKHTFKRMYFREPITHMPYNIKIGYYSFGDSGFWKELNDVFTGNESEDSNPFTLINQNNFPDISSPVYRKGITLELDVLKINFFDQHQNAVDIQLGLGYKYNTTLKSTYFEDINLKPEFHIGV